MNSINNIIPLFEKNRKCTKENKLNFYSKFIKGFIAIGIISLRLVLCMLYFYSAYHSAPVCYGTQFKDLFNLFNQLLGKLFYNLEQPFWIIKEQVTPISSFEEIALLILFCKTI